MTVTTDLTMCSEQRVLSRSLAEAIDLAMNNKLIVVAGGTGKLGKLIIREILQRSDARVRVLARNPGAPGSGDSEGGKVERVAFDVLRASDDARAEALRGAWSVVSAVQGGPDILIDAQLALLRSAKVAGARRFFASDYAFNFFTLPEGSNVATDWRRTLAERAHDEISESFEVVHVLNGMFLDRGVFAFLELLDVEKRVLRYWGDGSTPIDLTTWEDTAAFTAAAALDERRVPERLSVRGDRSDVFTMAKTWQAVRGEELTLERLGSLEELEREIRRRRSAEPQNLLAWLPLMFAHGVFGGHALLDDVQNDRYPEVQPEDIARAIARGAL